MIFESKRVKTSVKQEDGSILAGFAYFTASVYGEGETVPVGPSGDPQARPLAYWRSGKQQRGSGLTVTPPQKYFVGGFPTLTIPQALLDSLPEDAPLKLSWHFSEVKAK